MTNKIEELQDKYKEFKKSIDVIRADEAEALKEHINVDYLTRNFLYFFNNLPIDDKTIEIGTEDTNPRLCIFSGNYKFSIPLLQRDGTLWHQPKRWLADAKCELCGKFKIDMGYFSRIEGFERIALLKKPLLCYLCSKKKLYKEI